MMETNIKEKLVIPEIPMVTDVQKIMTYLPVAGYNSSGVAKFDSTSFILQEDGTVKLRRNPVRTINDFTMDPITGIGIIYYDDGTSVEISFPTCTDCNINVSNIIKTVEFEESSFTYENNEYMLALASSELRITDDNFIVQVSALNSDGYFTRSESIFKGSDGSILLHVSKPFNGKLHIIGSGYICINDVLKFTSDGHVELHTKPKSDYDIVRLKDLLDRVATVYKPQGSILEDQISNILLTETNVGNVYNVSTVFTTTSDFLEGPGIVYSAGTNIVVVKHLNEYKFDVLGSFIDFNNFYEKKNNLLLKDRKIEIYDRDGGGDTYLRGGAVKFLEIGIDGISKDFAEYSSKSISKNLGRENQSILALPDGKVGTLAIIEDMEELDNDVNLLKQLAIQKGDLIISEITQSYTERTTANGENIVDGQRSMLKKVQGNTTRTINEFDISKIPKNVNSSGNYLRSTDKDITLYGVNFQSDSAPPYLTFNEFFPYCKVGKTYTFARTLEYSDEATPTATTGQIRLYRRGQMVGQLSDTKKGYGKTKLTITDDILNSGLLFYGINANNPVTWENVMLIEGDYTNTDLPEWTPYFEGLKNASFQGIKSANSADPTSENYIEDTLLLLEAINCGLGTTIDFENRQIEETYAEYTFTGNETWQGSGQTNTGAYRYFADALATFLKRGVGQYGVCDRFEVLQGSWSYMEANTIRIGQDNSVVYFTVDREMTEEELQNLTRGMILRYPIATPTITPFTSEQAAVGNTVKSYKNGVESVQGNENSTWVENTLTQEYFEIGGAENE